MQDALNKNPRHRHRHLVALVLLLLFAGTLGGCLSSHNRPLQLLKGAGPDYPAAARSQGIEGEVTVRYAVTRTGTVTDAVGTHSTAVLPLLGIHRG